jgi:mannosylglycerate hydrolase
LIFYQDVVKKMGSTDAKRFARLFLTAIKMKWKMVAGMKSSRAIDASPSPGRTLHIHLLSHTHWDFEWYEIEEGFKLQLVRFIDHLLDTLEKDPGFRFHFDGQVMPIMDYLEVLAERDDLDDGNRAGEAEKKIRQYVQRGQLFIGPCWTTMETSVISTESLIRNINKGRRFSKKLGGASTVFYNADAFQYHSQVPQIIAGTALNSAFTWRAYKENVPLKDVTLWEGADKTRILKFHPARTYAQIWHLPKDPKDAAETIVNEALQSGHFAVSDHVLITQGNDQFEAQPDLNRIIREVGGIVDKKYTVDQITLDDFFSIIGNRKLSVLRGELTGNKWACTMNGQLSARMYLKQQNEKGEIFVEKWAEPFAAFNWLMGGQYQAGLIERAWGYLMKQHFHHLNACAVDAVHREGEVRYNNAIELARDIADESLATIAGHIDTADMIHKWESALVVFNPTGDPIKGVIPVNISLQNIQAHADWQSSSRDDEDSSSMISNMMMWDPSEEKVPFQVLSQGDGTCEIAMQTGTIPPFGFMTYGLDFTGGKPALDPPFIGDKKESVLENEWIKVHVRENGSFTLTDKRSNTVFRDLNIMEDTADHGDTYNYDPLKKDRPVTTTQLKGTVSLTANGPLMAAIEVTLDMVLPESLTPDRENRSKKSARLPIVFRITVTKDSPLISIRAIIENQVRDHRLRAVFAGVKAGSVYVQTQADVVKRPLKEWRAYPSSHKREITHHTSIGELPMETGPSPTCFQRNFVGTNNGKNGLVIYNKGLPEYEATPNGTIALTLLRCVGWISQDDLGTRKNLAGPKIAVPDAQCPGRHVFEYAVMPQSGAWKTTPAYRQKNRFLSGIKALQVPWQTGRLAPRLSFLQLFPKDLMVSCVKKAYKDGHLIVRFYNPTGRKCKGRLELATGIKEAWIANLNEKKQTKIPVKKDQSLNFDVAAKKIMTIAILPQTL